MHCFPPTKPVDALLLASDYKITEHRKGQPGRPLLTLRLPKYCPSHLPPHLFIDTKSPLDNHAASAEYQPKSLPPRIILSPLSFLFLSCPSLLPPQYIALPKTDSNLSNSTPQVAAYGCYGRDRYSVFLGERGGEGAGENGWGG